MTHANAFPWRLDRRINLSMVVELILLASLIVGSWVNLQRQLDLLQHDVTRLVESQRSVAQKLETLSAQSLSHEYRLLALENQRTSETAQ